MTTPLTREQMLAWIDGRILERDTPDARQARAAVAALYERCEALERAVEKKNEVLNGVLFALEPKVEPSGSHFEAMRKAIDYDGTEPSDAEGSG